MIDKQVATVEAALAGVRDGDTILVGGFGEAGIPEVLIAGLLGIGVADLTIVSNNAGSGETGVASLIRERRVRKIICSYPRSSGSHRFQEAWEDGRIELEVMPQGTLSERLRAGGAGLGGFFTPAGATPEVAGDKEVRSIGGRDHVLEQPLTGDLAIVRAKKADRWGNLIYNLSGRNFGPTMLTAATVTVVEVDEVVALGELRPEEIITPGLLVDRFLCVGAA